MLHMQRSFGGQIVETGSSHTLSFSSFHKRLQIVLDDDFSGNLFTKRAAFKQISRRDLVPATPLRSQITFSDKQTEYNTITSQNIMGISFPSFN